MTKSVSWQLMISAREPTSLSPMEKVEISNWLRSAPTALTSESVGQGSELSFIQVALDTYLGLLENPRSQRFDDNS